MLAVQGALVVDPTQIPGLAAWPDHLRILVQAVEHFQQDSRVPGLLLGGSFASGEPDFYSDLDLYIVALMSTLQTCLPRRKRPQLLPVRYSPVSCPTT